MCVFSSFMTPGDRSFEINTCKLWKTVRFALTQLLVIPETCTCRDLVPCSPFGFCDSQTLIQRSGEEMDEGQDDLIVGFAIVL